MLLVQHPLRQQSCQSLPAHTRLARHAPGSAPPHRAKPAEPPCSSLASLALLLVQHPLTGHQPGEPRALGKRKIRQLSGHPHGSNSRRRFVRSRSYGMPARHFKREGPRSQKAPQTVSFPRSPHCSSANFPASNITASQKGRQASQTGDVARTPVDALHEESFALPGKGRLFLTRVRITAQTKLRKSLLPRQPISQSRRRPSRSGTGMPQ